MLITIRDTEDKRDTRKWAELRRSEYDALDSSGILVVVSTGTRANPSRGCPSCATGDCALHS